MKAALFHRVNEPLTIEDVDVVDPGPDEVRVRTAASGVCHTDYHFVDGSAAGLPTPMLLGHEGAGVVEAMGADVEGLVPGDHVVLAARQFCGACRDCLAGRPYLCMSPRVAGSMLGRVSWRGRAVTQFSGVGSFAECVVTLATGVVGIPDDVPLESAALLGCGVLTGVGAALYTAKVPGGAVVAVLGCGGVGLNVIQGCRIAGASRILAVDVVPWKLELARRLGATDVIDAGAEDPVQLAKELTGDGVEFAFEAIGRPEVARQAFEMVRRGGTAVVVGWMPMGSEVTVPGLDFVFEKKLVGCMFGSTRIREHVPKLVELYRRGVLELDSLVSRRFALEDVNDAFDAMVKGEVARAVLTFS